MLAATLGTGLYISRQTKDVLFDFLGYGDAKFTALQNAKAIQTGSTLSTNG
jgi:hypothetical protein